MFCSDDKHPDELLLGHINQLAARGVAAGRDVFNVLQACSFNAIRHYGLNVGLLQVGDSADFALVDDLVSFQVRETYIAGNLLAKNGQSFLMESAPETINHFAANPINVADLQIAAPVDPGKKEVRVIGVIDGQLITRSETAPMKVADSQVVSDVARDLLKLVVVNRYQPAKPTVAFVRGFGFHSGAIASTVAHDSHNIIAVGVADEDLTMAINAVIGSSGGLSVVSGYDEIHLLPLPVAGLMSTESCQEVGRQYAELDRAAKQLGCQLRAPFMTLSFLALLVIPSLKLSDLGLFDGEKFEFVDLFI
jgi:adenine deaminase